MTEEVINGYFMYKDKLIPTLDTLKKKNEKEAFYVLKGKKVFYYDMFKCMPFYSLEFDNEDDAFNYCRKSLKAFTVERNN